LGKKIIFFTCSKIKLFQIYYICGHNNGRTQKFSSPSTFGAVLGSGINIPDLQHCGSVQRLSKHDERGFDMKSAARGDSQT
jgi:hypothetical protein